MKLILSTLLLSLLSAQDRKLVNTVTKAPAKTDRKAYLTPYYNLHGTDEALMPGETPPEPQAQDQSSGGLGVAPANMTAPMATAFNGMQMVNPMMYGMGLTQHTANSLYNPSINPFPQNVQYPLSLSAAQ